MVDQVFLIHVVAVINLRQRVSQTPILRFQIHVAFVGDNRADTHISILFRNSDIRFRFGIYAC